MIVCALDMAPEVAARFGVEPCVLAVFDSRVRHGGVKVLADIGLAGAERGVDAAAYIQFVRRIRPTWAVVPDKFADFRLTFASWLRYSTVIAKYAQPVFVAQEFHKPKAADVLLHDLRRLGVARVALPMRRHPDAACSLEPRLCAGRAERVLRSLCGAVVHIHLLGPALRSLRLLRGALRQCEGQGTVVSFDTAAYRRAPNAELKRRLGGRWMPNDSGEAVAMLGAWLRQALEL